MAPVLLLLPRVLAAPLPACTSAVSVAALETAVSGAEAAWGVDEDSFRAGVRAARAALPCVDRPLSPTQAARVHRLEGLAAFLEGDSVTVTAAFSAARAADPGSDLPTAMVPVGNPVRLAWDAAAPGGTSRTAPPPAHARLWIDGARSRTIPLDRAWIVQIEAEDSVRTAWEKPGAALPEYRAAGAGLRTPMLIGAGVLLAGTGVLAGLDQAARAHALERVPLAEAERKARQTAVNQLGAATVGVGVAAAATGVGAFVVGRW